MSKIIDYIVNMIPYMIIAIPIIIVIRYFMNRNKKINWYHEIALFLFLLFLVGLFSQTIIPKIEIDVNGHISLINKNTNRINLVPGKVLLDTYYEVFKNHYFNYFLINFLGNIVMFMPIGFFIPLLWKISTKKVILSGFSISLLIEFCQLFLDRGTDIDDLILNTLGTLLGFLCYQILFKKLSLLKKHFHN